MLTLSEYQEKAFSTAIFINTSLYHNEPFWGQVYCALQLNSEVSELLEKRGIDDIKKELGDILWYIAILSKLYDELLYELLDLKKDIPIRDYKNSSYSDNYIGDMMICTGKIASIYAKAIRKGETDISFEKEIEVIVLLKKLFNLVYKYMPDILEEVAEINLKKLQDRQDRGVLHGEGDNR